MAKKRVTTVAASPEYKPSMSIEGAMAKKMHGMKPGSHVHLHVHGIVTQTGINTYNGKKPTAQVEIQRISHQKKGR